MVVASAAVVLLCWLPLTSPVLARSEYIRFRRQHLRAAVAAGLSHSTACAGLLAEWQLMSAAEKSAQSPGGGGGAAEHAGVDEEEEEEVLDLTGDADEAEPGGSGVLQPEPLVGVGAALPAELTAGAAAASLAAAGSLVDAGGGVPAAAVEEAAITVPASKAETKALKAAEKATKRAAAGEAEWKAGKSARKDVRRAARELKRAAALG